MQAEFIQGASQEPFLATWTLGLTAKRRQSRLKPLNLWKALPFQILYRLHLLSQSSAILLGNRGILPWLSPRWLHTTYQTEVTAGSPSDGVSSVYASSSSEMSALSMVNPPWMFSITLQLAGRRISESVQRSVDVLTRVSSPFIMLNRRAWIPLAQLLQSHTLKDGQPVPASPVSSALPKAAPGWIARSGSKAEPEAAETSPQLTRLHEKEGEGTSRQPISLQGNAVESGSIINTKGRSMPYLMTLAGLWKPLIQEKNEIDSRRVSVHTDTSTLAVEPRLGQQPASPVLRLIADTIRQSVKREVADKLRAEAERRTAVSPPTEVGPPLSSTNHINDEMGRAVMKKLRSMAEEERFRSGKLR